MSFIRFIKIILDHKLSFLGAAIIGIAIGIYAPELGTPMGYVSEITIDLMKMCVLPIVLTSVTLSVAHFTSSITDQKVSKLLSIMIVVLLFCSIAGMLGALVLEPGKNIDSSSSPSLQQAVEDSALSVRGITDSLSNKIGTSFIDILLNLIPNNIFGALAQNSILQVIIFSLIFGVALGKFSNENSSINSLIEQTLDVFNKIFSSITYIFPIILIFALAKESSQLGPATWLGMGKFIIFFYITAFSLFTIMSILMIVKTKTSFMEWLHIMRETIIIAIATQSSTASIPPSIIALKRFNYDTHLVQLLIPLGSIIGRFGNIFYFGFCTIFAIQLYDIDLRFFDYILIAFLTILAGVSTTGQTGPTSLAALSLVLTPISIPFSGIYAILSAVDILIDPIRTLTIVHTNCAAVALMGKPLGRPLSLEEVENELED